MIRLFAFISLVLLIGCGGNSTAPKQTATTQTEDPKVTAAKQAIAKTTPEGTAIVGKAQAMKPEINEQLSAKPLSEVVEDFSKNKGGFNITPIGWEAVQKKSNRWKVIFHYLDYQKQYLTAEWELNPETNKLYPFDTKNAAYFWAPAGEKQDAAAKK